ncbi:MAG: ribonuclease P protein component [Verrucomicrobiota bacterium]|jgi:ribonuclease P protein component|nr:ribonuclease P protein component [Verrucomicrobiota bacterium]
MQPGGLQRPAFSSSPEKSRAFCVRATLGAKQRLLRNDQFRTAYDQNQRWHGRNMVLFRLATEESSLRLGVVASKKVGPAVDRARAKRRLREVFRRHRQLLNGTTDDLVLVARRPILSASWPTLVEEFLFLCRKAGVLTDSSSDDAHWP